MDRRILILVVLMLCAAGSLTACYPPTSGAGIASETQPDLEGEILEVYQAEPQARETGLLGAILVQGAMQDGSQGALVSVAVNKDTQLWQEEGQTRQPITFDSLAASQNVQVTFRGPVAESYPMQATADKIVVTR